MTRLAAQLTREPWGLARARLTAKETVHTKAGVKSLIAILFGDDIELRKRAADVVRRITEQDCTPLLPYADELAGLLDSLPPGESRTRWHLGLVVPRIAHTRAQRLRAARSMLLFAQDESKVARCSAVEGIALLALAEPSLRTQSEEMIDHYLRTGSPAMQSRARAARRLSKTTQRILND